MTVVITPAVANAWDEAGIAAGAAAVLRYGAGDVDQARLDMLAAAATGLIDAELDRIDPLDTALIPALEHAAVQVTIELYRRKDLPYYVVADGQASYTQSGDPVGVVRDQILPWKQRWGLA